MEDIRLAFGLLDRLYNDNSYPTQISSLEPKQSTKIPRSKPDPIPIRPSTPNKLPPFDEPTIPRPRPINSINFGRSPSYEPDFETPSKFDGDGND